MLQNPRKTLGFMKNMVYKFPPGGGGKPYPASGLSLLPNKKHKQILFYKMINGLCPDYLSSLVPSTLGYNTAYNLRNASDYKYIRSNTQLSCITIPFYLQSNAIGMSYPILLEMHQVLALLNTVLVLPLSVSLSSIWLASALVKFIILD